MENHTKLYDVGVIGLGVMGKNLALNIADNQYHKTIDLGFNRLLLHNSIII